MKAIKETIGGTPILIKTTDEQLEIIGGDEDYPDIIETGIQETMKDAYKNAKSVIQLIAEDIGNDIQEIKKKARPNQIEMEFNLGLSAQAGIWVLGAKSDYALKVKISWKSDG